MRARWMLLVPLFLGLTSASPAQQWFSIKTDHLISYSDGNDRGARDAALRGEQLVAVFGQIFHRKAVTFATPLRVLAIPTASNESRSRDVLVRTPVANYVIADLSLADSRAEAEKSIAALILEDNYPRAQPWFDSGIVSYLAGVRFTGDEMELGGLPAGYSLPSVGDWIPLTKVFQMKDLSQLSPGARKTFEAESWAVVRWLIDNSRLAQAGTYLNAVESRGATPERALAEDFSMGFADLDREVRDSLASLSPRKMAAPRIESNFFKTQKVSAEDAHVLQANLSLFGPEGDRTLQDLVTFMRQNQENASVHRSLAWAFLLHHDLENAVEHIRRALVLDNLEPTMHYLYARWVNHGDEDKIVIESAEVRMGTELRAALTLDPNYAAALELLGLAELSGDKVKLAKANLQRASALRPRSSRYYLGLARAYEAEGNLDTARNLFLYARAGEDATVKAEAGELLEQVGKEKKQQQRWQAMGIQTDPNAKHSKYDNLQDAIAEEEKAESSSKSAKPTQDSRKVEYLKGRIISVDCTSAAGATLAVSSDGHTWKMHVDDRNTIVLLGAESFDCGWHDKTTSINYKRSGNLQGDLISLEVN